MALSDETFRLALKRRPAALTELLLEQYPRVCRISMGLSGDPAAGRRIVQFVMTRWGKSLPHWRDAMAAERWFSHHAILAQRRMTGDAPPPAQDVLVPAADAADAAYVAFVRALRQLPAQQREAFLLHHGEKWNPRNIAVAMDCSTQAAETHLRMADQAMAAIAGDSYALLRSRIAQAYHAYSPSLDAAQSAARGYAERVLLPMRARRLAKVLVVLAVAIAAAWVAHRLLR